MTRIVSGIKPTGSLTLGNLIGAIKRFVRLQEDKPDTEFFLFIADLHALTTRQVPHELRKNTLDVAAMYLAAGLDPEKTTLFIQSEVKEHAELGYLLQSNTYMGELERMTQYKDKSSKQNQNIISSLFTYPALMAADILLYDADYVPVGDDQKQHLELTRDIAERFNHYYHDFFKMPEPIIPRVGARIMDLQNPAKKMSKSEGSGKGCITLFDNEKQIRKKVRSAVTDSYRNIAYDPVKQPGIANLLNIYAGIKEESIETILKMYEDKTYKDLKEDLADVVAGELMPIQERYHELIKSDTLQLILDKGRKRAQDIAFKKVRKAKRKVGLGRK